MDLKYAEVQVGEKVFLNHSKIKKEDAFEIIKDNSLKIIEEGSVSQFSDKFSFPLNFDVVEKLLGREGVYCATDLNLKAEELTTICFKSQEINGMAKKVNEMLLRKATVYIYSYYVMTVDKYIDDDLTIPEPWFWYRLAIKFNK